MAGVAKQQIEKLAYYPTLSRQMYKRKHFQEYKK